ncbi:hypothetical protein BBI01_01205 [Chryseobacterium artocarpi]|uniref:Uncharacterized protein n=1 Tax=Chryseobacterium artocarpi TaxID=1414727 RepID=A0A1B8ZZT1_9FLAO|nr:hypothetical protein BBI01_01205 [Chryseobacterium artocarpi]
MGLLKFSGLLDLGYMELNSDSAVTILAIISFLLAIALLMYSYLDGAYLMKKVKEIHNKVEYELNQTLNEQYDQEQLEAHVEKDIKILKELKQLEFDKEQKSELFNHFKEAFKINIDKDFFENLNLNISRELISENEQQLRKIYLTIGSIKERITNEIVKLNLKSNINLVVGSFMTIIALGCLGAIVYEKHNSLETIEKILSHYIPRISFILFIEVFAFFFLRLYKLNLNDIKYYQNELTNVDLKSTGLLSAINYGTEKDIANVIKELVKTERNFILNKGQSTIDLERFKNNEASTERLLKIFKNTINLKK